MSKETMLKIKFYIISILILLVLAVFIDIKLFDSNGSYLDLCELICCNWFSIISIVFIIMGFIFLLLQNHELNGAANPCCRITKIENVNYEFLTFLTTYIIPLICFDFDKTRYKIVFLILLIIIGIVFVKMNLYVANPILAIMGYRLYKVSVDKKKDNKDILVISRSELFNNDSIDWIKLDDTCWYVKRRNNEFSGNKIKNK